MRTFFLAMIIGVLLGSAVLADPANRTKLDYATPLDRLPSAKSAAGNPSVSSAVSLVCVASSSWCMSRE